jgi:hypothetical protein
MSIFGEPCPECGAQNKILALTCAKCGTALVSGASQHPERLTEKLSSRQSQSDRREEAAMWEYTTLVLTGGFMGRHKEELDRKAFDAQLDGLGKQGYELCWVLMDQALQHEKDGHVLIFKRQLP